MMKRLAVAVALALLAGQAQGATTDQFDLVCQATTEIYGITDTGTRLPSQSQPTSRELHYALDLSRKEWCPVESCGTDGTQPIEEVTSTTIVLKRTPTAENIINRTDGTIRVVLRTITRGGSVFIDTKGSCEKRPFTPFPAAKF